MLGKERKLELIQQFQRREGDTGSTEVQVAVLTERISQLTQHLQTHRKDFATQRGLLMLVGRRRRLLAYLNRKDTNQYKTLISRLGLRR